jgi:uncharacterized protein (TIGR03435 family)
MVHRLPHPNLPAFAAIVAVAAPIAIGRAQSVPATSSAVPNSVKFDVASLKPSKADGPGPFGIRPAPGGRRYVASSVPLILMIAVAYRLKGSQVTGGPAWINTDRFDMNAEAEKPSTVEELHAMLQNLLADRFKLQFHRETKELPVYALIVDKGGAKLQPHEARSAGDPWIDVAFDPPNKMAWHAKFAPMDYFAWRLSLMLDRPVIDRTELKGGYDFDLAFTPEPPAGGPAAPEGTLRNDAALDMSGPTIFDAVRQLGLKLERQKGPVDIMVIDHAEKPSEN